MTVKSRINSTKLLAMMALSVLSLANSGCSSIVSKPVVQIDMFHPGLEQVDAKAFDIAFVRPGIDFGAYTGILLDSPELAFQTPDRSQRQFPLDEAQKTKFAELLAEKFRSELATDTYLTLEDAPAPHVLRLKIRVQDISATVLQQGIGNTGRAVSRLKQRATVHCCLSCVIRNRNKRLRSLLTDEEQKASLFFRVKARQRPGPGSTRFVNAGLRPQKEV